MDSSGTHRFSIKNKNIEEKHLMKVLKDQKDSLVVREATDEELHKYDGLELPKTDKQQSKLFTIRKGGSSNNVRPFKCR